MVTNIIEVTEAIWKYPWPPKIALRDNMHMDTREIKAADFKSKATCDLQEHLEASMSPEAIRMTSECNMDMV